MDRLLCLVDYWYDLSSFTASSYTNCSGCLSELQTLSSDRLSCMPLVWPSFLPVQPNLSTNNSDSTSTIQNGLNQAVCMGGDHLFTAIRTGAIMCMASGLKVSCLQSQACRSWPTTAYHTQKRHQDQRHHTRIQKDKITGVLWCLNMIWGSCLSILKYFAVLQILVAPWVWCSMVG